METKVSTTYEVELSRTPGSGLGSTTYITIIMIYSMITYGNYYENTVTMFMITTTGLWLWV